MSSIDHNQLASAVVRATGHRDIADALVHFLNRTMMGNRGLPQGLVASDTLATAYLAQVDRAMIRNGFEYTRHGDDVRISVDSYGHGCRAARVMESEGDYADGFTGGNQAGSAIAGCMVMMHSFSRSPTYSALEAPSGGRPMISACDGSGS